MLATHQKIGNDEEVTISKLTYNELGQVVKKQLHLTASSNTGMQIVDYRYNERGWLSKINNADLVNDGDNLESWDVFGEELLYDNAENYISDFMEVKTQFIGNVAAIKWKTNRTPDYGGDELAGHSYVFRYDELGQMTGAFYAASADTYIDNYSKRGNMWDETLKYDANGNVININRNRGVNEQGAIQTSPLAMDRLSFTYKPNSNTLLAVNDFSQSQWITNEKYSHFINGCNTTNEYFYDDSGRLTKDLNKGIDEYEYNALGLISKVVSGSEAIDFIWNAAGVKLAKAVASSTTYYIGEFEFHNAELQSIYTAEGVARCPNCMLSGGDWKYDYYLTDHLGNIRAVITEEDSELIRERVTVEVDRRTIEDANFENVTSTEKDKPYLYPYDPNDPYNMKVTELTSFNGKIIGPAKVIEVKEGEKIDLSTQFWYTEESGNPLSSLTEILAGTLLNLSSSSLGIIESGPDAGLALLNNVNSDQFGVFSNFINNAFSNEDFSKPQAYLVYITFDKKMMIDPLNSGTIQVGNANELGLLEKIGIQPKKDGYFYTYVTNKSEGKVNFNNLQITRWAPSGESDQIDPTFLV